MFFVLSALGGTIAIPLVPLTATGWAAVVAIAGDAAAMGSGVAGFLMF
jgi:hypothetical protein